MLAFMIPGDSTSSVYTIGRVTNGPPSFGQFTMGGISLILHSFQSTGPVETFIGKAETAANPVLIYEKGCLMASIGLALRLTMVLTSSKLSLKINRLRSKVPKILETAGNLLPFKFSNKRAGPWFSKTRR